MNKYIYIYIYVYECMMNTYISLNTYENDKGLLAAFPCSRALEPWPQGGETPHVLGTLGRGNPGCKEMMLPSLFNSYMHLYSDIY